VGTLGIVDFDVVDESNLQRQVLHGTRDIGRPKLDSAEDRLRDVNPHVTVVKHPVRLSADNALEIVSAYDIVVDGTDNFPTRYLVNDACVLAGKPNVYGSIFRWEGQVSVFGMPGGPCYRCLFREPPPPGLVPNCAEGGVLGVLPGIIGSLQAMETVKLLLGAGRALTGRLLIFDALDLQWREVGLRRNPDCPVCGDAPTQRGLIDYEVFCGVRAATDAGTSQAGAPGVETARARTAAATTDRTEAARSAVREVEPAVVADLLGSDHPPFLLDVREPWEWAVGNLGSRGARLVPLAELSARIAEVPRDREIVVYCKAGPRSRTAAHVLVEAGFPSVANLSGGLLAWAREIDPGLPVV